MDLPNEVFVKKEDPDLEIIVKTENLNYDWFIDGENVQSAQFEDSIGHFNVQKCCWCNEIFFDWYSLLQHNLIHLSVNLIKLPDKVYKYHKPIDMPGDTKQVFDNSNLNIKMDLPVKSLDSTTSIKIEVHELKSDLESDNEMNYENNNNIDIPITKRQHQCHICLKIFNYKRWHAHMNEVHSKIKVKCKFCNKDYKSERALNKHACSSDKNPRSRKKKVAEKKVTVVKCCHCDAKFTSKDCMQKHMKNVHSKPVVCEICGSRLGSDVYLAVHIKRVHYDDGKVHNCEICGKIFKSPRYVKIHMKNCHSVSSKKKV